LILQRSIRLYDCLKTDGWNQQADSVKHFFLGNFVKLLITKYSLRICAHLTIREM
jgi:hypothetical protein